MSISKKKVKPVKVVNYNINAANCNVLTMMHYVHCLRNINNQSSSIYLQIIRIDIEVEYFCAILFITTRHRCAFFCKYNAQNLVWNWLEVWKIVFHSILASSIFHTEIFVLFHFIPCPGRKNSHGLFMRDVT